MGLFSFLTQEIAIDLGTANTLIIMNDKVVVDEPSIVAKDIQSGKVVAIGKKAQQMHGKTHKLIETVRCPQRLLPLAESDGQLWLRGSQFGGAVQCVQQSVVAWIIGNADAVRCRCDQGAGGRCRSAARCSHRPVSPECVGRVCRCGEPAGRYPRTSAAAGAAQGRIGCGRSGGSANAEPLSRRAGQLQRGGDGAEYRADGAPCLGAGAG